jgi:uncharacterized SAM-binding protein YcdF (DUF218 family)
MRSTENGAKCALECVCLLAFLRTSFALEGGDRVADTLVFFVLSKILDLAFAPLSWALAFVMFSVLRTKTSLARRRLLAVLSVGLLYVFALDPVQNRLVRSLEQPLQSSYREKEAYDAVILLGGLVDARASIASHTVAFNDNVERVLTTFELLRGGRVKHAILSGGDADGSGVREADVLKTQLVRWGIDADRLIVEGDSKNTRDNAVFSKAIAEARGWRHLVIVTSAFHMARAKGCFNAVGLAVDTLSADFHSYDSATMPVSFLPRASFFNASTWALREYSGRLVYRLRGYTSEALIVPEK